VSSRPHPESERPLHGPLQSFNLDKELARLRQEEAWQQGQRNAIYPPDGRVLFTFQDISFREHPTRNLGE
jgi:hypothetical protein